MVHDHWHPYYTMTLWRAARALQRAPSARTGRRWSRSKRKIGRDGCSELLRRACHAVNLASRAEPAALRPEMIALIERCYDAVVADGLAYHTAQPALTKARPRGPPPRRVGPQSAAAAQHAQSGRAPLPDRPERAVHQQSRRARRADDEIAAENLRWLPGSGAGRRGLRRYPIADLDRQKAGLGSAPDTHSRTGAPDRPSPLGLTTPPTWLVTIIELALFADSQFLCSRHSILRILVSADLDGTRLVLFSSRQK